MIQAEEFFVVLGNINLWYFEARQRCIRMYVYVAFMNRVSDIMCVM